MVLISRTDLKRIVTLRCRKGYLMKQTKQVVFTAGLPASGKSTTAKKIYQGFLFLDCDEIKKQHPDYNPKAPELIHEWSKKQLKINIQKALEEGINVVIDTTATNKHRLLKEITMFKKAGYKTTILYCSVKLETALQRNAKRERTVPPEIIYEKHEKIEKVIDILKYEVDNFIYKDNN